MLKQLSRMVSTSKEESLPRESTLVKEKSISSVASSPRSAPPLSKAKSKTFGEINPFDPKVNVIVLNGDVMPTVSAVRVPGLHPRRKIASLPGRFVTLPIPEKLAGDGLTDTEFSNGIVIEEVVEDEPIPQVAKNLPSPAVSPRASIADSRSPRSQPASSPRGSEATSPRPQINSRVVSMSRAQSKTVGLDVNANTASREGSPRAIDISTTRASSTTSPRFWAFTKTNSATSQVSEDKSLNSSASASGASPRAPNLSTTTRMPSVSRGDSKSVGFDLAQSKEDRTSPRMWAFAKTNSAASHVSVISTDDKDESKSDTVGEEKLKLPEFPTALSPREQQKAAKLAKLPKLQLDNLEDMDSVAAGSVVAGSNQSKADDDEEVIVERPLTDFEATIQTLTDYLERPFAAMFHLYAWANLDDKERRTTKDRPTVTYEETVTLLRAMVNWSEFGDKARFFTLSTDEQTVAKELYMKVLTLLMVHGAIATGCDMSEVQRWHGEHLGYRIGGNIWSMSDLQKVVDYQEEPEEEVQQQTEGIAAMGILKGEEIVDDAGDASMTAESK